MRVSLWTMVFTIIMLHGTLTRPINDQTTDCTTGVAPLRMILTMLAGIVCLRQKCK